MFSSDSGGFEEAGKIKVKTEKTVVYRFKVCFGYTSVSHNAVLLAFCPYAVSSVVNLQTEQQCI